jgi:hypothetical protein
MLSLLRRSSITAFAALGAAGVGVGSTSGGAGSAVMSGERFPRSDAF